MMIMYQDLRKVLITLHIQGEKKEVKERREAGKRGGKEGGEKEGGMKRRR